MSGCFVDSLLIFDPITPMCWEKEVVENHLSGGFRLYDKEYTEISCFKRQHVWLSEISHQEYFISPNAHHAINLSKSKKQINAVGFWFWIFGSFYE